jgi:magnesium chelatase accessory protein
MLDTPPNDWPDRGVSRFLEVSGIRWHLQTLGQPAHQAPTVLLVHGTGGATHSWAAVTPLLAPHAHIVALDLPGHGFTVVPASVERARNPFALAGMARVLSELLTELDVRPDVAVGHSAGVSVLLRMAVDGLIAPQRLVGICPALVAPPQWYITLIAPLLGVIVESDLMASSAARLAAGTRIVQQMLHSTGTVLSPVQLARYRHLCMRPTHVHAALSMMARWDLPALLRDSGALRTPLQLVAARGDRWIPLAPLRRAVQRLPGMRLVVEEGGHLLPEERPEVVVREVLAALAPVPEPGD